MTSPRWEDLTPEEQDWFRREYERTQLQIVPVTDEAPRAPTPPPDILDLNINDLPPLRTPRKAPKPWLN